MLDDILQASVNIRLEKARECLKAAENSILFTSYATAANRLYYAIFHSIRAVLLTIGYSSRKHSGIIAEFRQRYIKTEVFPPEFSDIINNAFNMRNNSDYEDFFIVSKEDVIKQIENAKTFLASVEAYINTLR